MHLLPWPFIAPAAMECYKLFRSIAANMSHGDAMGGQSHGDAMGGHGTAAMGLLLPYYGKNPWVVDMVAKSHCNVWEFIQTVHTAVQPRSPMNGHPYGVPWRVPWHYNGPLQNRHGTRQSHANALVLP